MKKKLTAIAVVIAIITSVLSAFAVSAETVWKPNPIRAAETLDRGLVAVKTTEGIYLSWRLQADEDNVYGTAAGNVSFDIYRDGKKIATESQTTNYIDKDGSINSKYQVAASGKELCKETTVLSGGSNYFDIPLDKPEDVWLKAIPTAAPTNAPPSASTPAPIKCSYSANDASCGDLDGDGEYEIILKWDCNAQDNSISGFTGNVYLDAYKLDGTKLWRIDLGQNIRAGAHYTQFIVYDFDGDGKAEVTAKTAPGSKDGKGAYVTKASHVDAIKNITDDVNRESYVESSGKILTGDEYLTIFNGETGAAEDTIYYPNQRIAPSIWGDSDSYGNRCDRFTAAVAYLDGVTPYAVYMRGYYMGQKGYGQRQAACAVSFDGNTLDCKYSFDTYDAIAYGSKNTSSSYDSSGNYKGVNGYVPGNEKYAGEGNHNCTVADVDNDGRDEVMTGALCYEINDSDILMPRWCTYRQHGDALHIGDYDPTHSGYEFFVVHEDGGTNSLGGTDVIMDYGMSVIDGESGELMFHEGAGGDTGRGIMANVGAGGYYQFWSSGNSPRTANGNNTFTSAYIPNSSYNFRIFWDGDLYDELLDGTTITSFNGAVMMPIFNADECTSVNGSKANPSLQADLFGDWREEVVYPLTDSSALRVFTTNIYTDYKMKSLMYDSVYRSGVAAEQTAYNQPPHIGYYIDGGKMDMPEAPDIDIPDNAEVVFHDDAEQYNVGMLSNVDTYTGIDGLSVSIGGGTSRRSNSKVFGAVNTDNNNKAFVLAAGQYSTALRGPVMSFTNDITATSDTYGVLTFAVKLSDGNQKGALYLLSDTVANRDSSDYANKIAAVTTDDIGNNKWAVVKYVFKDSGYELYINNSLKTKGSTTHNKLPIIGMNTAKSSSSDPYTGMIIDNIYTYTISAPEPTSTPNYIYYENMSEETTNYNGAFQTIEGSTTIIFPEGGSKGTTNTYTLASPVTIAKNSTITFDHVYSGSNTAGQKRTLEFKNSSGTTLFSMSYTWANMTFNDTVLGNAVQKEYSTVFVEIDPAANTVSVTVGDNTVTQQISGISLLGNDIASINFVSAGGVPGGRYLGIRNLYITAESDPVPTETPAPTAEPTASPTIKPTSAPTPTNQPTATPTAEPTNKPTDSPMPTAVTTNQPTEMPTAAPTASPAVIQTDAPTSEPTAVPTDVPSASPSAEPAPSDTPTPLPELIEPIGKYAEAVMIEKEISDGEIILTVTLINDNDNMDDLLFFAAEYDENGTMTGVKMTRGSFADGSVSLRTKIPESENYRLLLWDTKQTPLMNVFKETLNKSG